MEAEEVKIVTTKLICPPILSRTIRILFPGVLSVSAHDLRKTGTGDEGISDERNARAEMSVPTDREPRTWSRLALIV